MALYTADGNLINVNKITMESNGNIQENTINLYPAELELQQRIKYLLSQGGNIRANAAGHSNYFDNSFYPGTNAIDTKNYLIKPFITLSKSSLLNPKELEKSDKNYILTASAGHRLDTLRNFLKLYSLRLLGTPESMYITLGGAVVVGAHHGSALQRSIADYVTEMLLFDDNGEVVKVTDPNLFINYGALGIVFRISIRCFPAKNILWKKILHKNIEEIRITPNTHSLVFGPYTGKILETLIYPTNLPAKKSINRHLWEIIPYLASYKLVSNITRGAFYVFPSIGLLVSEYFLLEPDVIRDKYDYFEPSPQTKVYTLEYSLDAGYLKEVYSAIMNLIGQYRQVGMYVSYRFWVRFMPASDQANNLAHGRDSAIFELTFSKDQPNAASFAKDIDMIFRTKGGKPHLGKTLISTQTLSNYDFEKFKKEIAKFDPNGIYQNDFMKKSIYLKN